MGIDLLITVIDKTIRQKRRRLKKKEREREIQEKEWYSVRDKGINGKKWNKGLRECE